MPIEITDVARSTGIVIAAALAALLLTLKPSRHTDLLPVPVTTELKGLAILTIVFAHISYMLVSDSHFLYPLSVAAGVGVDLFLFASGYGLTIGMLRNRLAPLPFYHRRLSRVFIPFWFVIVLLFAADRLLLGHAYSVPYMLQSLLGWFPRASAWEDVNSPFWYITWLLMFYALYPLLFATRRPWLSALALALIANVVALANPFGMQANWLHRLHTLAFSLGMLLAWLLAAQPELGRRLIAFRDAPGALGRRVTALLALALALYVAANNNAGDWPRVTDWLASIGVDAGFAVGQATSLVTMAALLVLFAMKRLDSRVLNLVGVYSYEIYLLHWPLMSRYDVFYRWLPAWLATLAWLAAFIGIGWVLRKALDPIEALLDRKPAKKS